MWIQYRFHHAVQWEKGIPITGPSITVARLERSIIAAKLSSLRRREKSARLLAPLRLLVFNADTGEEYGDENEEIPANSSVIVRLLTLWSTAFLESKRGSHLKPQLTRGITEGGECTQDTVVGVKGPRRSGWHYFKTPPPGYVCHRCHVPGHYIQACPTNGDPSYDIKGKKYTTAVSTAASEKDVVSSTVTVPSRRYPKVLNCPLCKEAMKEAVMMRCCFSSFCDECIRDRIISRSLCACGARNVCLDDLIPNKTLRETIKRLVPSASYTSENERSCCLQASGSGTDRYSETADRQPCILESAPTKSSREPVAARGVTDQYSVTSAPLSSTLESVLTGGSGELVAPCGVTHSVVWGASKQIDSPTSLLVAADMPTSPLRPGTPNVMMILQQSNDMGGRKRELKRRRDEGGDVEDRRSKRRAGLESPTAPVQGWSRRC